MRLLILGGTVFLGRSLVQAALEAGHQVTLFNRGKTNPELFPEVEKLVGDRCKDLVVLRGHTWDAAIDTSGYLPRIVSASASRLKRSVQQYTFISSISVYQDPQAPGPDECSKLAKLADESTEEITGETYGGLKALCERAVNAAMPGQVLTVRPGLIVGPHDPTDRFSYWPLRIARGGEVLVPGRPDAPLQIIDVRDLVAWNLRMIETGKAGAYNATGPAQPLTLGEFLDACKQVTGSDARFTWVSEDFLLKNEVKAFQEMPCWVPQSHEGLLMAKIDKALAKGLGFRPLAETIRDTIAWRQPMLVDHPLMAGLSPEREKELLAAWHARD